LLKGERLIISIKRENNQRIRNKEKNQMHLHRGSRPQDNANRGISTKESLVRGGIPKGIYPFPLMSKGDS
jgi:hypothetical protein